MGFTGTFFFEVLGPSGGGGVCLERSHIFDQVLIESIHLQLVHPLSDMGYLSHNVIIGPFDVLSVLLYDALHPCLEVGDVLVDIDSELVKVSLGQGVSGVDVMHYVLDLRL